MQVFKALSELLCRDHQNAKTAPKQHILWLVSHQNFNLPPFIRPYVFFCGRVGTLGGPHNSRNHWLSWGFRMVPSCFSLVDTRRCWTLSLTRLAKLFGISSRFWCLDHFAWEKKVDKRLRSIYIKSWDLFFDGGICWWFKVAHIWVIVRDPGSFRQKIHWFSCVRGFWWLVKHDLLHLPASSFKTCPKKKIYPVSSDSNFLNKHCSNKVHIKSNPSSKSKLSMEYSLGYNIAMSSLLCRWLELRHSSGMDICIINTDR